MDLENKLKSIGFLKDDQNMDSIRSDLHLSKYWYEIMESRRYRHANRLDPEIKYLASRCFDDVLEIGCAYGRFSKKFIEGIGCKQYMGVEVNSFFNPLEYVQSDIFTFKQLNYFKDELSHEFDLVVLPMNTLPSFPAVAIDTLLDKVASNLNDGGKFVFTTYKTSDLQSMTQQELEEKYLRGRQMESYLIEENYHVEKNHIEETDTRILLETYEVGLQRTNFGIHIPMLYHYRRYDNHFNLVESDTFWSQIEFISHEYLLSRIEHSSLDLVTCNDDHHSLVYELTLS